MTFPRFARRIFAVLAFVIGLLIAMFVIVALAYQGAKATSRIGVLVGGTLIGFFICSLCVISVATRLWGTSSRRPPFLASAALVLLFGIVLSMTVLSSMHVRHVVPIARANTQYWKLPSGSRIAYSVYQPPAGIPDKPYPIVFLHGGPGLRATDFDHKFYSQFTQDGFTVYLYDQAGSGFSDRLPRAADYTLERYVADLEDIRKQIGASRMILIGHSWGGTLAAYYAAAHQDRVEKLIFHSPGPIWIHTFVPFEFALTAAGDPHANIPPPRVVAAFGLSKVNVSAAENLVSQTELGDWELSTLDPRQLVCHGEANKLPNDFSPYIMAGTNMYPILVTNSELHRLDIRPQLSALHIPSVALFSECDMIPWSDHVQYKESIPGLQEFYFADAGHSIDLSQPAKLATLIRSFLFDQPPPFPAYRGDGDPRPPIPIAIH